MAPLQQGAEVGKLRVTLGGRTVGAYPLHPIAAVEEAGFFGRLVDDVKLWFH